MKAAVLAEHGLEIRDVPRPKPKATEILVQVRAAGLNRADVLVVAGRYAAHATGAGAPPVMGIELAGEVVEVGAEVRGFKPGDRIMGAGSGAYAEYAVADAGRLLHIPANNMSYEQAATLPVALGTAHDAIMTTGRLKPGEAILVQGSSSGVGLMAMQIAKEMGARIVFGTSTTPARRAKLKDWGADVAVDTGNPAWPEEVLKANGGKGVELIIDLVSAGAAVQNVKAAAPYARIVNIGRLGGFKGEFDFNEHAMKRISYIGSTFRIRTAEQLRDVTEKMKADLWPAVEAGKLKLPIDRSFPLDQTKEALAHMAANAHFGKILLTM